MTISLLDRISWDTCDGCGGDLPLVDGDNGSAELPDSVTAGECPGYMSDAGNCGCYSDAVVTNWLEAADAPCEDAD